MLICLRACETLYSALRLSVRSLLWPCYTLWYMLYKLKPSLLGFFVFDLVFTFYKAAHWYQTGTTLQEQCGDLSRDHLERLYVFALMWSTGAILELDDRRKMEIWLRRNESIRLNLPDIPLDSEDTMFDYYVTADGKHACIYKQMLTLVDEMPRPIEAVPWQAETLCLMLRFILAAGVHLSKHTETWKYSHTWTAYKLHCHILC